MRSEKDPSGVSLFSYSERNSCPGRWGGGGGRSAPVRAHFERAVPVGHVK